MTSLESVNRIGDEIEMLYATYTKLQQEQSEIKAEVEATEQGINGEKIFKIHTITSLKTSSESKAEYAVDGKASTYFEGEGPLQLDLGGIGFVGGLEIKFKGGPFDFTIEASLDNNDWYRLPVFSSNVLNAVNEFERFEFHPLPLVARYIRISSSEPRSNFAVTTIQILGRNQERSLQIPSQADESEGEDEYGIKKICKSASSGRVWKDLNYKYSEHNTGNRNTFSKKADVMSMECTGYYKINLSDDDEEISTKIYGGEHASQGNDEKKKRGRCYCVGIQQNGEPSFKKEYPKHNETPDFSDKVKIASGMPKRINSIKNRWIGMKVIAWPDLESRKVNIQCWIDDQGLKNGDTPANDWKMWYTVEDAGNLKGEPYLELQGSKHGGDDIYYIRIDKVPKDSRSPTYGLSVREIVPPNQ